MADPGSLPEGVEATKPNVARLYDFLLGGHHNFAADREFARRLLETEPNARTIVAENRAFLGRAVRYLIASGVRQFLDLGSGIPTRENVHEIAQRGDPAARVVYVDNDPVAVAHSRHILGRNPLATVVNGDMREPAAIFANSEVGRLLDLSKPVGLLMVTVLHFIPDSDDPAAVVRRFAERLAPGSYLVISHATHESAPGTVASIQNMYRGTTAPAHTRTAAEVTRLFDGFDLVEPGLVFVPLWRPDARVPEHPERIWFYAGVGRKAPGG